MLKPSSIQKGTGNSKEGKTAFNTSFTQGVVGTKDKIFYEKKTQSRFASHLKIL